MATTSHFYITLFSNASRDIYERNKHADFTVKLGSTSNWEVGLFEISCSSPQHMGEDITALIYCKQICDISVRQHRPQYADVHLPIINIIIVVSTRVSKRVLCACRTTEILGRPN